MTGPMARRFFVNVAPLRTGAVAPGRSVGAATVTAAATLDVRPIDVLGVHLDGRGVEAQVAVEPTDVGLRVTGTATGEFQAECCRCLQPLTQKVEAEIDEELTDADIAPWRSDAEPDGAIVTRRGDELDLTELVREALTFALPALPLCRADCEGPMPERYPVVIEGDEVADADADVPASPQDVPPQDPRWAALSEFRVDPDASEGADGGSA